MRKMKTEKTNFMASFIYYTFAIWLLLILILIMIIGTKWLLLKI
jgi:hypothetical protein